MINFFVTLTNYGWEKVLYESRTEECQRKEEKPNNVSSESYIPLLTHTAIGLGNAKLYSTAENKQCGTE